MHDAGHRRAAAALYVGGRSGDGARRRDPAEEGSHHVGDSLGHQLHVRPVTPPIMPSATTADSSDSTAPSAAMAKAGPDQLPASASETCGSDSAGNPAPGSRRSGCRSSPPEDAADAPARSSGSARRRAPAYGGSPGARARGSASVAERHADRGRIDGPDVRGVDAQPLDDFRRALVSRSPSTSRSCWTTMITAMPEVKPVTTGKGMNLIAAPSRARPKPIRSTPAMSVATVSPSIP